MKFRPIKKRTLNEKFEINDLFINKTYNFKIRLVKISITYTFIGVPEYKEFTLEDINGDVFELSEEYLKEFYKKV